jgi:hypothetical protein
MNMTKKFAAAFAVLALTAGAQAAVVPLTIGSTGELATDVTAEKTMTGGLTDDLSFVLTRYATLDGQTFYEDDFSVVDATASTQALRRHVRPRRRWRQRDVFQPVWRDVSLFEARLQDAHQAHLVCPCPRTLRHLQDYLAVGTYYLVVQGQRDTPVSRAWALKAGAFRSVGSRAGTG